MHQKSISRHKKAIHRRLSKATAVSKKGGIGFPLHIQKIFHVNQDKKLDSESELCREEMVIAARSGMTARECYHLMQVNASFPETCTLQEEKLLEMSSVERYRI